MADPLIWTITDEDAQTAEDAEHADKLTELSLWAVRFADVLATVHGAMARRLTPRMADNVTLEYARIMLKSGYGQYEDSCADDDDGSDWRESE
jgi:hypothetical protein